MPKNENDTKGAVLLAWLGGDNESERREREQTKKKPAAQRKEQDEKFCVNGALYSFLTLFYYIQCTWHGNYFQLCFSFPPISFWSFDNSSCSLEQKSVVTLHFVCVTHNNLWTESVLLLLLRCALKKIGGFLLKLQISRFQEENVSIVVDCLVSALCTSKQVQKKSKRIKKQYEVAANKRTTFTDEKNLALFKWLFQTYIFVAMDLLPPLLAFPSMEKT